MSDQPRVTSWTTGDVAALLERTGFASSVGLELIGSGHWSDCFAFVSNDRPLVCRIGNHLDDFEKDQFASRFDAPGLPVPQVLAVGPCDDQYYAISERVFGDPLEQTSNWAPLVEPVADLLEALRTADVTATTGWGRWDADGRGPDSSWREFLLRVANDPPGGRMHGWQEKLAALPAASAAFDEGYERLEAIASDEVPRALVHNDLYHRNVLTDDGAVNGVFDWGISFLGDPLYDVAMLCFWSPWFEHIDEQQLLAELRRRWPPSAIADFALRFEACMLHMALEHIGYTAALGHSDQLARIVARLEAVAVIDW